MCSRISSLGSSCGGAGLIEGLSRQNARESVLIPRRALSRRDVAVARGLHPEIDLVEDYTSAHAAAGLLNHSRAHAVGGDIQVQNRSEFSSCERDAIVRPAALVPQATRSNFRCGDLDNLHRRRAARDLYTKGVSKRLACLRRGGARTARNVAVQHSESSRAPAAPARSPCAHHTSQAAETETASPVLVVCRLIMPHVLLDDSVRSIQIKIKTLLDLHTVRLSLCFRVVRQCGESVKHLGMTSSSFRQ